MPILLLPATLYQRKARDEAAAAEGHYGWSRSLINRPVAFYLATWACFLVLVFILTGVLAALGVSPHLGAPTAGSRGTKANAKHLR